MSFKLETDHDSMRREMRQIYDALESAVRFVCQDTGGVAQILLEHWVKGTYYPLISYPDLFQDGFTDSPQRKAARIRELGAALGRGMLDPAGPWDQGKIESLEAALTRLEQQEILDESESKGLRDAQAFALPYWIFPFHDCDGSCDDEESLGPGVCAFSASSNMKCWARRGRFEAYARSIWGYLDEAFIQRVYPLGEMKDDAFVPREMGQGPEARRLLLVISHPRDKEPDDHDQRVELVQQLAGPFVHLVMKRWELCGIHSFEPVNLSRDAANLSRDAAYAIGENILNAVSDTYKSPPYFPLSLAQVEVKKHGRGKDVASRLRVNMLGWNCAMRPESEDSAYGPHVMAMKKLFDRCNPSPDFRKGVSCWWEDLEESPWKEQFDGPARKTIEQTVDYVVPFAAYKDEWLGFARFNVTRGSCQHPDMSAGQGYHRKDSSGLQPVFATESIAEFLSHVVAAPFWMDTPSGDGVLVAVWIVERSRFDNFAPIGMLRPHDVDKNAFARRVMAQLDLDDEPMENLCNKEQPDEDRLVSLFGVPVPGAALPRDYFCMLRRQGEEAWQSSTDVDAFTRELETRTAEWFDGSDHNYSASISWEPYRQVFPFLDEKWRSKASEDEARGVFNSLKALCGTSTVWLGRHCAHYNLDLGSACLLLMKIFYTKLGRNEAQSLWDGLARDALWGSGKAAPFLGEQLAEDARKTLRALINVILKVCWDQEGKAFQVEEVTALGGSLELKLAWTAAIKEMPDFRKQLDKCLTDATANTERAITYNPESETVGAFIELSVAMAKTTGGFGQRSAVILEGNNLVFYGREVRDAFQ